MTTVLRPRVGWPLLAVAGRPAAALGPLAAAVGVALLLAGALAVLPAPMDAPVLLLAVLLTAAGTAAVADDPAGPVSVAVPVPLRRRFAARALTLLPLSAAGLVLVLLVASLADAAPDGVLVQIWCAATAVALSVAAATARAPGDLSGGAVAAGLLIIGMVGLPRLPGGLVGVAFWDSAPERLGIALAASLALVLWATRDPATS